MDLMFKPDLEQVLLRGESLEQKALCIKELGTKSYSWGSTVCEVWALGRGRGGLL